MVLQSVIRVSPTALHHTELPLLSSLHSLLFPCQTPLPTSQYLKKCTANMQEIHTLMLPCPQPFSPAMSGVALADICHHKKPAHRRDNSDELDVFEAARYYSGLADAASFRSGSVSHRAMKEERRALGGGGEERRSIDVPMRGPTVLLSKSHKGEKPAKEKKSKQPISPGGRLASFLNSFFHQGSSKKKSKSIATTSTTPSCKDEDAESPAGRRKRRSSISHCRSTRSSESSSFIYSSSSAFRTPSFVYPQGKVMKEEPPRNKCSVKAAPAAALPPSEAFHDPREKSRRASTNGIFEKGSRFYAKSVLESDAAYCGGLAEKRWVLNKDGKEMARRVDLLGADELPATERSLWRREEEEDGGESDSSSDLFELPNCSLVHLASGLPVYETTSMESIKINRGSSSVASVTLL